ncbi:hypothetical protein Tco_0238126 [Tanacetum coccineum]
MDVELLDLHDRYYARQAVVNNAVNRRSRELLEVIEKLRGECDVIKERERAQEEESESLRVRCEAAMSDFEKNPTISLWEKISTLSIKITSLEAEKAQLKAIEVSLQKEVGDVKRDRMEVFSKVVPYAAMELIHSDDLGSLVGRYVSSAIFYGRCKAFEQVAVMKELFDLSKKPLSLQRPAPSKTQSLVSSSPKATPSSVPGSNSMSPPVDAFVVKPVLFLG